MLNIGVLGAGHLGKIHLKCIGLLPDTYNLVGFYDPDPEKAADTAQEFGVPAFDTMEALFDVVDVVDVVTPTLSHYDCASQAIRRSKHLFIEKPVTNTLEEAQSLIKLCHEAGVHIQVGHVERFNPAFTAAQPILDQPRFIETHRLAQFNPRGTDVSVVLDLMIHDIDIVLHTVGSSVKAVHASGVAVMSDTPDIANARLEFDNGCVANLTASRISLKNMRKTRFFQRDAYVAVDFLEKQAEIVRMQEVVGEPDPFAVTVDLGGDRGHREILFDRPDIQPGNAIRDELGSFAEAVLANRTPVVTIEDGYHALEVAHRVLEKIQATTRIVDRSL